MMNGLPDALTNGSFHEVTKVFCLKIILLVRYVIKRELNKLLVLQNCRSSQ